MRLSLLDFPDLPLTGFRAALGKNRPATLEKSAGNAPNAPDPYALANSVTQANKDAAIFNKILNQNNYSSPFGSQQTGITGWQNGAPIFGTSVSASPEIQNLLNQQIASINPGSNQALSGYLGSIGGQSQDVARQYEGLFNQLNQGQAAAARQQGQDAAYKAQSQYLDPRFAQQESSMEAKLAAQGLAPGSQAFNNAFLNFQNEKQRAYSDAANQAILTGSQIGAQDLQNQIAGMTAQGNALQGKLGAYGTDINSIMARSGLDQRAIQNLGAIAGLIPGYSGVGQAGATPADLAQALQNQYLGQLGQYNAQQQGRNATLSSLGSLAGGLFNLSGGGGGLGGLFGGGGGLGTAGSALSSFAPGVAAGLGDLFGASIGGTYGAATQAGLDALIGSLGGFSGGGAGAATGAAAGAGAAGGAGGAGGATAGASGAAGGMGAALGAALPAAIIIGGVLSMFQPGTQPSDISAQWASGLNQSGTSQLNPATFNQFRSEQPALDSLLKLSTVNGQFDFNRYREALSKSTVGGKHFEGKALDDALLFGRTYANNPQLWGSQAQGTGDWQQRLYADQGGG